MYLLMALTERTKSSSIREVANSSSALPSFTLMQDIGWRSAYPKSVGCRYGINYMLIGMSPYVVKLEF